MPLQRMTNYCYFSLPRLNIIKRLVGGRCGRENADFVKNIPAGSEVLSRLKGDFSVHKTKTHKEKRSCIKSQRQLKRIKRNSNEIAD